MFKELKRKRGGEVEANSNWYKRERKKVGRIMNKNTGWSVIVVLNKKTKTWIWQSEVHTLDMESLISKTDEKQWKEESGYIYNKVRMVGNVGEQLWIVLWQQTARGRTDDKENVKFIMRAWEQWYIYEYWI